MMPIDGSSMYLLGVHIDQLVIGWLPFGLNQRTIWIITWSMLGLAFAFAIGLIIYRAVQSKKVRKNLSSGNFIYAREFEDQWIVGGVKYVTRTGGHRGGRGFGGYYYEDGPGCYVILVFNGPVNDGDYSGYKEVYVGQSVNMCKRVHDHLNGRGKGDIYADYRNGRFLYIQFVPCSESEMNETERSLIAAFDATKSYNNTRGGGKRRY